MKFWGFILLFEVIGIGIAIAVFADSPPSLNPLGRQYPYLSVVSVPCTQTVTTLYELKYLRTIQVLSVQSNLYETNFVALRTNVISVSTNDVRGTPP